MQATVLMLHSGGFTSRQWRRLSESLSSEFNVITPDLLGYGDTPWPDGEPFHFDQDLDYVRSLVTEPMHLVGHSYGGFLALKLAIAEPSLVKSIAAYEPVAFGILDEVDDADARAALSLVKRTWDPDASGTDEAWLAAFVDWWNGNGAWSRLPEETRTAMRSVGWKVFQEVLSLAADRTNRATYATITAPTLLLGGSLSPLTERRVVENLASAMPHANAQFFEGVGHMGPITHARVVNEAIEKHLKTVGG